MTSVLAPEAVDDVGQVDEHDAPPEPPAEDPEAPYGRRPDGTPYKRPAEWRAKLGDALNRGRRTQAAKAPPRKAAKKPATGAAGAVDYRPGVTALLQLPAFALGLVGRYRPAFALDAATITLHTPGLAEAVHQTALVDERLAMVLEKVLQAGPYGALLGALLPVALQIAANHRRIPVSAELGILSPEELIAALERTA
jgi:hypothetical protein